MNIRLKNPILANDIYKLGHADQVPGDCTYTYSHLTPRFLKYLKAKFPTLPDKVVVFGLQLAIKVIVDRWKEGFFDRKWEDVEADTLLVTNPMIGWVRENLHRFKALHEVGYLPLHFKGLPEGAVVNVNIPVLTVVNTDPRFGWLPNFIEPSFLNTVFKPMTVATLGLEIARLRDKYFDLTVSDPIGKEFAWHDFSYRGHSGHESAYQAIIAYLLYTKGTDTFAAVEAANYYYGAPYDIAGSIPAFEHSTATSGIQFYKGVVERYVELGSYEALAEELEISVRAATEGINAALKVLAKMPNASQKDRELAAGETFNLARVLIDVYPEGFFAYVSDSYDYNRLISIIVPALKDIIMSRNGKFVIRPDSGNPVHIVCGSFTLQGSKMYFQNETACKDKILDLASDFFNKEIDSDSYCDEVVYNAMIKGKPALVKVTAEIGQERGGSTDNDYFCVEKVNEPTIEYIELTPEQKGSIQILAETFGTTTNAKGYKELPFQIGLVYGDGINFARGEAIYEGLMHKGFAASNVVLAAGAFMLANLTRDDLGFAIKASNTVIDGISIPVYKEPKTDSSKTSAKGLFKVIKEGDEYILIDNVTPEEEATGELKSIWKDDQWTGWTTFTEIQNRLPLGK
jgi:nicotinamide phosphoribosyltransferase